MSDFQLSEEEQHRLTSAIDMIGRMGAKDLEFAYVNDEPTTIANMDWWAKANFRGSIIFTEHHIGPIQALEGLVEKVSRGAKCRHCGNTIQWGVTPRTTPAKDRCVWDKVNGRWERGCRDRIPQDEKAISDEVRFVELPERAPTPASSAEGELPKKIPGRHRWVVTVAYTLTDDEMAKGATAGGERVVLDEKRRLFTSMGCWDCEEEYRVALNQRCPSSGDD